MQRNFIIENRNVGHAVMNTMTLATSYTMQGQVGGVNFLLEKKELLNSQSTHERTDSPERSVNPDGQRARYALCNWFCLLRAHNKGHGITAVFQKHFVKASVLRN